MKDKDSARWPTLRLIKPPSRIRISPATHRRWRSGVSDADIHGILGKMTKQRQESVRAYEEGGRLDLAERERAEIAVIEEFLPRSLSDEEGRAAIDKAIADVGATSIRDMGKIMG